MNFLIGYIFLILSPTDSLISEGWASYYHNRFNLRKTASGEIFSQKKLTAAHKTLPFGSIVKVKNLKNNEWVVVVINDRLPQSSKRSIDLSRLAAETIGMIRDGVVPVSIEIIREGNWMDEPPGLISLGWQNLDKPLSRQKILKISPKINTG